MKMNDNMDEEFLKKMTAAGDSIKTFIPKFSPMDKVWLKCSETAGMVIGITMYADRIAYVVRWADGSKEEHDANELTDNKSW